jgi:SAM-dependent MidA family methyltransferase
MLTEPDPEARECSRRLLNRIKRAIDAEQGSIGFDRYMDMALYDPALGYYRAGARKFGASGDFVTAPEVSPLFACGIARACAPVLSGLEQGDILEFGAGSGILAVEVLAELERLNALPRRYCILELSGDLAARQAELLRARLPHLLPRFAWLQALPKSGFEGVVLANEVLDAMPARCFSLSAGEIQERRVGCSVKGNLMWVERPADASLRAQVQAILAELPEPLPDGYCSELNPALAAWIATLSDRLRQGLVLITDYGYPRREYYHPQRRQGTLLCHYRHRAHDDPFFCPGLQDISANVDFTAVAEAGAAAGLQLLAYGSQAQLMISSGIHEAILHASDEMQRLRFTQQIKRLILPSEMGDRFQVMALGRNVELRLDAFRDQRSRL